MEFQLDDNRLLIAFRRNGEVVKEVYLQAPTDGLLTKELFMEMAQNTIDEIKAIL